MAPSLRCLLPADVPPAEGTALSQVLERRRNAKPYIEAKVELKGGRMHISWDHPSQDLARILWADGLGTDDMAFGGLILAQLAQIDHSR
jgi:hypothetical protein